MEANKILSADILDILFENRNKSYGAYELRKTYNRRIWVALAITAGIAAALFLYAFISASLKDDTAKLEISNEVVLEEIKQEEEKKPEPPPPPPPPKQEPPKVEMTKFTPPKIVKDEEVKKEDIPPEVEKLEDTKIDIISQEGVKDEGFAAPPVVDAGKQVVEAPKVEDENKVFEKVEVDASFTGGESAWRRFLERNLNASTPVDNGAPPGSYQVVVQFIVDKTGSVSDVKALTKHGYGMEDEAVKVIKRGPKWVPAIQNGRNVNAYRKQPITFVVAEE
ncbi:MULTISPECIES: energy transducer TonB [Chitinophagaceae]|uniref:energy transducer TonB n=1 Tax=Chitinophagaceae TaxID=563835 RepID=UPI000DEF5CD5|nr:MULTISPECIES: energy transducer TonB [Chitinophagaceae]RPD46610.1 energy transducer TonB [Paracnuella aquatica]